MNNPENEVLTAVIDRIVSSPDYKKVLSGQDDAARELREYIRLLRGRISRKGSKVDPWHELAALRKAMGPFDGDFVDEIDWGYDLLEEAHNAESRLPSPAPKSRRGKRSPPAAISSAAQDSPTEAVESEILMPASSRVPPVDGLFSRESLVLLWLPLVLNAVFWFGDRGELDFNGLLTATIWLGIVGLLISMLWAVLVVAAGVELDHPRAPFYALLAGLLMTSYLTHSARNREARFLQQLPRCIQQHSRESPDASLKRVIEDCRWELTDEGDALSE